MNIFKSRKTAVAITAVAVVASTLLGSHRSLAAQRRAVEKTVTAGADGSGYSIATDGQTMVNVARNLMTVAKKYLPGESAYGDLEAYCRQMEEAGTDVSARKKAQGGIRSLCEGIQQKLAGLSDVSEGDRKYLSGFAVDLEAACRTMSLDPYNALADQFNRDILGRFPASVLGPLTGIRPLEKFEGRVP